MPSKFLGDADSELQSAWLRILDEYNGQNPGKGLIITCTYRSEGEQQALFAQGRTKPGDIVTNCDGVTEVSNHNYYPSRAIDFAVVIGGKISWNIEEYKPVGELAVKHGLVWGGNWKWKDSPHIELKDA